MVSHSAAPQTTTRPNRHQTAGETGLRAGGVQCHIVSERLNSQPADSTKRAPKATKAARSGDVPVEDALGGGGFKRFEGYARRPKQRKEQGGADAPENPEEDQRFA